MRVGEEIVTNPVSSDADTAAVEPAVTGHGQTIAGMVE
jgi:hypothetical protein